MSALDDCEHKNGGTGGTSESSFQTARQRIMEGANEEFQETQV